MTKSLYSKFILGYLLFGLLGFIIIATFSSHVTELYLVDIYQGKNVSLATAKPQLDAVATYLKTQVWVIDSHGMVIAETAPESHVGMLIEGFDPTAAGNKLYMIGSFWGAFPNQTLSVLAPITGNFNTYGYVALHLPMAQVTAQQNEILNIVYVTSAFFFYGFS